MRNFRTLAVLPVLGAFLWAGTPANGGTDVGVGININIGPPPVIVSPPAELVLIPETGVYFIPDGGADIFFYGGYWWAPRGAAWYRANSLDGPWVIVERRLVSAPLLRIPGDYRTVYRGAKHIPYGQWKKMHRGRRGGGKRGH